MTSLILATTTRFMLPLLLLYALFLLFRGHNHPGGGFVAGLVAGGAFALYALAFGVAATAKILRTHSRNLVNWGLAFALLSGLVGMVKGKPFLTGQWFALEVPNWGVVHLGTPLLFDLGVFFTVFGTSLTILLAMMEE